MSPRGKRIRKMLNPPIIKGLKPYGMPENISPENELVVMLYEEYESIKLCDYDMLNHHAASELMGVSRPTFTRIYASARQKIALALAEGRQLRIEGGKVCFDSNWFECNNCKCYFNNPDKEVEPTNCPLCGSKKILETANHLSDISKCDDRIDECICTECGYLSIHTHGNPCRLEVCPHCEIPLRRRNNKK
ncbi:MAG: DUF134 domain-containing protein [Bacteroidales bacterium]|jgi:predicted DNA-binding protein (UPF0251 family)|nr:DUF134 domain-containing protein [Bacteroidales bacterium]